MTTFGNLAGILATIFGHPNARMDTGRHPHRNASGETITVQQYVIDVDNAINRNIVEYDQFVSEYPR